MKTPLMVIFLFIGFLTNAFSTEPLSDVIEFASLQKANELLTQEDEFVNSWSQFDIDSRVRKPNSTREDLLNFITDQSREWTQAEKKRILSILKSIDGQIAKEGFKLDMPEKIFLVKTTTKEEGDAQGYTRATYIVLKEDILSRSKEDLKHTIIHELFHVLTRNNPAFRKEMYSIIGFQIMNEVAYPESLKAYRITNPDAPQTDSFVKLKVGQQLKECMMILYADEDYTDGDFFKYLNVGFLSLTGDSVKEVEYRNDRPMIFSLNQVTGFFEQVGKNTKYIIHPEEILAENFAFALLNEADLPNSDIVNKIKTILRN